MELAALTTSTIVSRDNFHRIHRITRGNRSLWYQLTVLQQPERARACGAGIKANSDRRPVDPPPVVELRIVEGPSVEQGKDVTFDYNANFFLYASLEQARPMAHGRLQTPATTNPPILTGVPASGMAYLDRPYEAGYFIFPDLSVRHEGYFHLSFSLFESTKEEKDFDIDPSSDMPPGVDWRMEIKTVPFSVFSAKKFPGLMESTSLSKIVADQGCRVRIRRDVRMRKRDRKPASSSSSSSTSRDPRQEAHGKPAAAKPPLHPRDRSLSKSGHTHSPHVPQPERRISAADPRSAHPPPPAYDAAAPAAPAPAASSARHLSFGKENAVPVAAPASHPLVPASHPLVLAAHRQPTPHHDVSAAHRQPTPHHDVPAAHRQPTPHHDVPAAHRQPTPHHDVPATHRQPTPHHDVPAVHRPCSSHVAPLRDPCQSLHSPCASESSRTFAFPPMSMIARPSPSPSLPNKPEAYEPRPSLSHVPASPSSSFSTSRDYASRRDSYATQPATPTSSVALRPVLPDPRCSNAPLKISSLMSPLLPPLEAQTEPLPPLPDILTGAKRKHEVVFDQASSPLHNGQRQVDFHYRSDRSRILPEPHMYTRADGKISHVQFNTYN